MDIYKYIGDPEYREACLKAYQESYQEGYREGRQMGREWGCLSLLLHGAITVQMAAECLSLTEEEVRERAATFYDDMIKRVVDGEISVSVAADFMFWPDNAVRLCARRYREEHNS